MGFVRTIDDLGRIVIPKEIRKKMNIKVRNSLEISIDNNENIVLKKFSNINNIKSIANIITTSINSVINENVIITDMEHIISSSGSFQKYLNKKVSSDYLKLLNDRVQKKSKDFETICIVDKKIKCSFIFSPIIVNGELIGSIIIFSENRLIQKLENDILNIIMSFLIKYLEE